MTSGHDWLAAYRSMPQKLCKVFTYFCTIDKAHHPESGGSNRRNLDQRDAARALTRLLPLSR